MVWPRQPTAEEAHLPPLHSRLPKSHPSPAHPALNQNKKSPTYLYRAPATAFPSLTSPNSRHIQLSTSTAYIRTSSSLFLSPSKAERAEVSLVRINCLAGVIWFELPLAPARDPELTAGRGCLEEDADGGGAVVDDTRRGVGAGRPEELGLRKVGFADAAGPEADDEDAAFSPVLAKLEDTHRSGGAGATIAVRRFLFGRTRLITPNVEASTSASALASASLSSSSSSSSILASSDPSSDVEDASAPSTSSSSASGSMSTSPVNDDARVDVGSDSDLIRVAVMMDLGLLFCGCQYGSYRIAQEYHKHFEAQRKRERALTLRLATATGSSGRPNRGEGERKVEMSNSPARSAHTFGERR